MASVKVLLAMMLSIHIVLSQPIDEKASRPTCFPTDWSHAWSRVGNVWYTILPKPGKFFEKEKECRMIEHGRTQMGRLTTEAEQKHISTRFLATHPTQELWIGGMRLAEGDFYWYRQTDDSRTSIRMEKIKKAYWTKGNPDNAGHVENCIEMHHQYGGYGGQWNDRDCAADNLAVCELRC